MEVLGLMMYGIISALSEVEDCIHKISIIVYNTNAIVLSARSKFFVVSSLLMNPVQEDGFIPQLSPFIR